MQSQFHNEGLDFRSFLELTLDEQLSTVNMIPFMASSGLVLVSIGGVKDISTNGKSNYRLKDCTVRTGEGIVTDSISFSINKDPGLGMPFNIDYTSQEVLTRRFMAEA